MSQHLRFEAKQLKLSRRIYMADSRLKRNTLSVSLESAHGLSRGARFLGCWTASITHDGMTYLEVPIGEAQREMIGDRVVILFREAQVLAKHSFSPGADAASLSFCGYKIYRAAGRRCPDSH
ncbi:hypothetical protein KW847_03675 [Acidovorax sp. sif0715]|nr:hypothetical protein [Acidovorax sp. sif0732]MBV7448366.1 hypothetical protein [Acidovorax sp. sif0715]